jgi:Domain of unknown function (DUF4062)
VLLIIDRASSSRLLEGEELRRWAESHTAFISSEMSQLGAERDAVAVRLRDLGMRVVMFEDLGGRDEDALTSYLDGVARSDIYIGMVGDRYGRMQSSRRSATHEEYLFARERGKRISVWVAVDDANRQGNAHDFVQEVEIFHATGRFRDPAELAVRVAKRVAELAADDEAPWVKVGDAVFRASVIRDLGNSVEIEADVRDRDVAHHLEGLRPDGWHRRTEARITTSERSGTGQIEQVIIEVRSTSARSIRIEASIAWEDGTADSMAAGTSGYSAEDLAEIGLRAGLLGESPPERLSDYGFLMDTSDPLAELLREHLSESSIQSMARLLVVEQLIGGRRASRVEEFSIGPEHLGGRRISLTYIEARRYSNVEPAKRAIKGMRRI